MRRLAQALLRLRHYLPPSLAPAGQSLTKIETLRLAIRYIAHLSALLGLSEEALARQRGAAPRHCPLCPQGLGCCQTPDPRLHLPTPAPQDALPPGTVGWGSPPMVGTPLELHGAPGMGTGAWGSPPCGLAAGTPPEVLGVPDTGMEAWGSPPYIPVTGTPPELHGAVASNTSYWLSPPHCTGAGAPPDLPSDPLLDAGLTLPEFVDAGTVTQVRALVGIGVSPGGPQQGAGMGWGSGALGAPLALVSVGTGFGVTTALSGVGNGVVCPPPSCSGYMWIPQPAPILPGATLPRVCWGPISWDRQT